MQQRHVYINRKSEKIVLPLYFDWTYWKPKKSKICWATIIFRGPGKMELLWFKGCTHPRIMFICMRKYNYVFFFKDKAVNKNVSNLTEDIIEVLEDNTQKKGWKARIKEDSTALISITTNMVILQSNYTSEFQQNEDFSQDKWLYTTTDNNQTLLKIREAESQLSPNVFWPYRYDFQNTCLKEILSELSFDTNNVPCVNHYH